MAGEDEGGALIKQVIYRGEGGADALVVGDFLFITQGDIEVGPDEDFFALYLNILD